jgi:hypothetical protein
MRATSLMSASRMDCNHSMRAWIEMVAFAAASACNWRMRSATSGRWRSSQAFCAMPAVRVLLPVRNTSWYALEAVPKATYRSAKRAWRGCRVIGALPCEVMTEPLRVIGRTT